ncbi:MAG: T9SS type A sorting domain-containing protein [Bacteroidia bacterium]|nr:T9SS type A sorting domain-containing protein [Bacteroidia bacterium]
MKCILLGQGGEVFQANPWYDPTGATSDYFNQCAGVSVGVPSNALGVEPARTGGAYCGFYTWRVLTSNYREYIQVKLNDTLEWGKKYYVAFYVSHAENTTYATNRMGAYFSQTPVNITGPGLVLSYPPQIESDSASPVQNNIGWRLIEDTLFAIGGELYITIGNFYADSLTDTLFVGGPGISAAYYYIDDVSVTDIGWVGLDENAPKMKFDLFPNPNDGKMVLNYSVMKDADLSITDITGKVVCTYVLSSELSSLSIDCSTLQNGVYLYSVTAESGKIFTGKILVIK